MFSEESPFQPVECNAMLLSRKDALGGLDLELKRELESNRVAMGAEVGELDLLEGNHRWRIAKRLPWEGKLLTQPQRHDEARAWFSENLCEMRRGLEMVAPLISS